MRAVGWGVAVLCAPCAVAGVAHAQVFQTDAAHTPLPQPVGAAELSLGQTYGYSATAQSYKDPSGALLTIPIVYGQYYAPPAFPQFVEGDELTLSGLFKWRKEQIDPITNAKIAPGHFFPGCGFSAELVLHGGNCNSALGWYNATPSGATPPAASEIYPLVPGGTSYLASIRTNFVPLGWDNRDPRDLSTFDWTPKSFSSGAIQSDPRYKGGDVAFALVADPLTLCTQNKFSVYEHNVKNSSGIPWVTGLIYKSTVDPSGIYLAFEDLPMSTADWHQTGSAGSAYTNDGDFNDFVFFISGLGPTTTCPDPACKTVTCGVGTTCAGGVCVPSGTGGAGAGGSANSGGGSGGTSVAGASAAGGLSAGGGLAGSETSVGGATAGGATAGGATAGGATMGGATMADGSAGAAVSGDTGRGGTSETTATGGSGTSAKLTNGGCSCRMGLNGAARYHLIWLALSAAFLARRRRFQRC